MTIRISLLLFPLLLLFGCALPPVKYANALQRVMDESMNEVDQYAWDIGGYEVTNGDEKAKAIAVSVVRGTLKDPDSATFRNVRLVEYKLGKLVCGEVNAKNSYGGYVGFKRFAAGTTSATIEDASSVYPEIARASNVGIDAACWR